MVPKSCGNSKCEPKGESCNICPADCGACCGNGKCESQYGEDRYTCKDDCKPLDKGITPGDKGGPPGDGAPLKQDKGGVKPCAPDSVFCAGTEIRKCSKDGKSAPVTQDCKKLDFPGVNYSCKVCSNGQPGCQSNKKEFIKGFSNGRSSFQYSYGGFYSCEKEKAFASVLFTAGSFTHMVTPNGNGSMPILSVTVKNPVSGKQHTMTQDSSAGTPQITVSMVHSTSPSVSCTNYYTSAYNPPTVPGVFSVTYSGTSKGSTIKIIVSGQLYCYESGGGQWENFAYTAEGIVF